jgi:hypothetical protein
MRLSTPRAQQGRSIVGKIVLALVFASVMVGISMGPALSADHDRRDKQQERYRRAHQPPRRVYQPPHVDRSYGYYPPPPVIYAPPPVIYAPPPSPGISLFFELPFRSR